MGISLFPRKKKQEQPAAPAAGTPTEAATKDEGPERLTANDWAKRHGLNEVMAERAAMRAGRWHDLFTDEEFQALLRRTDV